MAVLRVSLRRDSVSATSATPTLAELRALITPVARITLSAVR